MLNPEKLADFAGAIGLAAARAPNEYAGATGWTYEENMADIKELWEEIYRNVVRDSEKADFINAKIDEMFAAFENGKKDLGRKIAWLIYNSKPRDLR